MGFVEGRVVLITGASSGIGLETSRELARRGAQVVMAARNRERGEQALEDVRRAAATAGSPAPDLLLADLTDPDAIAFLIERVRSRYRRLHVLINNAGGFVARRAVTAEGFEYTYALNVVAPIRLTLGVLGRLRKSRPARIINVASQAHAAGALDLDDLQMERGRYRGFVQYARSKTALILWTRALACELRKSGVTVNAVHPGWIKTAMGASNPPTATAAVFRFATAILARPQIVGARGPVYLADDEQLQQTTGEYYFVTHQRAPAAHARDSEIAGRMLELGRSYDVSATRQRERK